VNSMIDPLDPLYRQNPKFHAEYDGRYWLIRDADGRAVACDHAVHAIWSAFENRTTEQAIVEACTETGTSPAFAESTAKVLARAGVLVPSHPLPAMECPTGSPLSVPAPLPLVSVVVLAGPQARAHMETCLPSLTAQTHPEIEIILVDNQTADDTVAFVQQEFPQIRVLSTPGPLGFAAANNLAIEQTKGQFIFLLNDDTELEPDCIAECVRVMLRSDTIAAVAPKMKLFLLRSFLNSMGNSLYLDGRSCDNFVGYLDVGQFDTTEQVFSACFGAAMLRRSAVEEIGHLDEAYHFYYEDIDWSFRARLCGYDIVAAPRAVVYHKFSATMGELPSVFKLGLVVRNRMRFIWKNLDARRAWRLMRIYGAEDLRTVLWAVDKRKQDIARAHWKSWRQWVWSLPKLAAARWRTRRSRHPAFRDDAAFALVDGIPRPLMYGAYPVLFTPAIRKHYMKLARFQPESPPLPEDMVDESILPPVDVPLLMQNAQAALRERGFGGLMKESWRYLYWRITTSQSKR
jgi:GT2 family glycosyltransferase